VAVHCYQGDCLGVGGAGGVEDAAGIEGLTPVREAAPSGAAFFMACFFGGFFILFALCFGDGGHAAHHPAGSPYGLSSFGYCLRLLPSATAFGYCLRLL